MMPKLLHSVVCFILTAVTIGVGLVLFTPSGAAEATSAPRDASAPALAVEPLLNSDGMLDITTSASGSVDLRSWNVQRDPQNGPVLSRANAAPSDDFVITVKTDITGPDTTSSTAFEIKTHFFGLVDDYNYNVDCNNDGTNEATGEIGDYICLYGETGLNTGPGTYTIRIKDNSGAGTGFPRVEFGNGRDAQKLLSIDQWGTGKWTTMIAAFEGCTNLAGQASDSPDLSGVTDMSYMFSGAAAFNQNIGNWNTANVIDMSNLFAGASAFNQNIGNWNTANVIDMRHMFDGAAAFNQNVGNWNTANVTDMFSMFEGASAFNQNIGNWNTANVEDMDSMFADASAFNQNVGNWNTANVEDMNSMFAGASAFNQNIGNWNTANVTNMSGMFWNAAAFSQNIGNWSTANVTDMSFMFSGGSAFNGNIGNWNTGNVTDMFQMFDGAGTFNQNIGGWDVGALTDAYDMFQGVTLSTANYDALLNGWDAQTLQTDVYFDGGSSKYCAGEAARTHMIQSDDWHISDGGKNCSTGTPTSTPTRTNTPTRTSTPTRTNTPTATSVACAGKPGKPNPLKPADNSTVTKAKAKLNWSDAACVTDYQVIVKNTETGKKVFKAVVTASKAKTGDLPTGHYKWFVKARNAAGITKSTTFTFMK